MVLIWDVLDDVIGSLKLACETYDLHERDQRCKATIDEIYNTVRDYVINNYGES